MSQHQTPHTMSFLDIVWHFKFQLVGYIIVISFLSFIALYIVGGVPEELKVNSTVPLAQESTVNARTSDDAPQLNRFLKPTENTITKGQTRGELPVRVIIDKIGVNTFVSNPASTNIESLNNELLKGGVRYPGSGTLGQGNMFLFGHSTSLKIVNNQAFKAFNNVKNLNIGDTIRVLSSTKEFTYTVTSVSLVESDKQFIDLKTDKNMLTIATCNVKGEKEERFVVEAVFVRSSAL